jgi:carboxymethylenebutenolidase
VHDIRLASSVDDAETTHRTPSTSMRHVATLLALSLILVSACQNGSAPPDQTEDEMKQSNQKKSDDSKEEDITDKMAEEHEGDSPIPTGAVDGEPAQPVESKEVEYAEVDGRTVTGYMATPKADADGTRPGLIVIQEWWGLNDNIRAMTRRLAGQGYNALAVDLYEGEVAETPKKARSLMQEAMNNKSRLQANLKQAYQYLDQEVGAPKIGVIGWCFGGGWSLQTALMFPKELDATVVYYGELVTDESKLKSLEMPIVGFFGSEDSAIPPKKVRAFESTLEDLGKEASIHLYEGANHAFANPSGERYDPEAAEDAWNKTVDFLKTHLRGE